MFLCIVPAICLVVLLEEIEQHTKGHYSGMPDIDTVDEALCELENVDMSGYGVDHQVGERSGWVFWWTK